MGNAKSDFPPDEANQLWKSIVTATNDSQGTGNRSGNGSGSGYSSNGQQPRHGNNSNNNKKRENKIIIVSNLNRLTKSQTIHDVFSKFGHLYTVDLNTDENDEFDGTATVQFGNMPRDFDINNPIKIDGRKVTMKYGKTLSEDQRPSYCNAQTLSLGTMLTPTEFVDEWSTDTDVKLSVFYDKRQMKAEFRHINTTYFLEIKFKDITNDVVVENIGSATYLTIPLKQPAMFSFYDYQAQPITSSSKSTRTACSRASRIPLHAPPPPTDPSSGAASGKRSPTGSSRKSGVLQLNPNENYLRLETWTVYRIKFDPSPVNKHFVYKLLNGMADYNLVPRKHQPLGQSLTVVPAHTLPRPLNHEDRTKFLPFDVLYMLECCITSNYLLERNLNDEFYSDLQRLVPKTACLVLDYIAQDKKRVWDPLTTLRAIWKKHNKKVIHHKREVPPHCSMLRKIIITPTAAHVQPPTLETTNRIVRKYERHSDRFIRVQFTDEDLMRIGPSFHQKNKEKIYNRVFQILTNGLRIGNRHYDYLGFSSSQLREHGCWFFAGYDKDDIVQDPSDYDLNADSIREWMGDFSDIKIVAKHAARIGQCFSSTKAIFELTKDQVEFIDDIVHNGYTFSDGVGNISYELASEVARKMSIRVVPSAFQFRLGGAKGVLMVGEKLKGFTVQLRPSQIKFNSDHYMLEVIRTSSHISAYLNRQAITLLSSLGVKDEIFMDKLNTILTSLNGMLAHSDAAIKILQANADEFGTSRFMANIISAGYLDRQDPFIKNLLNMFRVIMLKNLKEKAKIPVDKGAFLFGVVDETGSLKADEVFCQVTTDTTQTSRTVIEGECVVFRNPCFHPGDIRVVNAVDCPNLHHLKDVLVFSGVGYRDVPSMCSGGDLDGDDYTILWDDTLMPAIVNQSPMDYTPSKPMTKPNVTTLDIQKFFVNYMNNDNLGQIANAHLATADDSDKGAMDGRCKRLAQLHSSAVDFPKTGIPAKMQEDLKVHRFPDFMGKEDKPMYKSKKVLGQMYRQIDKADYDGYESQLVDQTVYDSRLKVDGMEKYIHEARKSRQQYNWALTALMNQYGVKTETEMISGFVITWLKRGNKKSDYDVQKQTASAVETMKKHWRSKFLEEFMDLPVDIVVKDKREKKARGGNNNNNSDNDTNAASVDLSTFSSEKMKCIEAKVAAWYYVTYHPTERALDLSVEGSYFSFPWVMDDVLISLGRRFIHRPQSDTMTPIDESVIMKYAVPEDDDDGLVVVVQDPDDDDDGDDDEADNDDTFPTISKEGNYGAGNDNFTTHDGNSNDLISFDQQSDQHVEKHNEDDNDNDEEDDDDSDEEDDDSEEDDDDEDDDDDDDDDDTNNSIVSLDEAIKMYEGSIPSSANLPQQYQAVVPMNRENQITVDADATEDDLAAALL